MSTYVLDSRGVGVPSFGLVGSGMEVVGYDSTPVSCVLDTDISNC